MMNKVHTKHIKKCILIDVKISKTFTIVMPLTDFSILQYQQYTIHGLMQEQGKSEGFDSCDRPSNLAQIWSKSSIFCPLWPWNLMDGLGKQ